MKLANKRGQVFDYDLKALTFTNNQHAEAATGNGPVDAVYEALNRITQFFIQ